MVAASLHRSAQATGLHHRRQQLSALYTALLGDCEALQLPVTQPEIEHAWHLYVVRLRPERLRISRDALEGLLRMAWQVTTTKKVNRR